MPGGMGERSDGKVRDTSCEAKSAPEGGLVSVPHGGSWAGMAGLRLVCLKRGRLPGRDAEG